MSYWKSTPFFKFEKKIR